MEYRKKLIRVAKGDNFELTRTNVEEWIKKRLGKDKKASEELVRRESNYVWFECKGKEIKEKIAKDRMKIKEEGC